jgi:hypothetical protein
MSAIRETKLESKVTMMNIRENPSYKEKLIKDTGRGTVPCLYIGNGPKTSFEDIPKKTKGSGKLLDINSKASSKILTDFLTE